MNDTLTTRAMLEKFTDEDLQYMSGLLDSAEQIGVSEQVVSQEMADLDKELAQFPVPRDAEFMRTPEFKNGLLAVRGGTTALRRLAMQPGGPQILDSISKAADIGAVHSFYGDQVKKFQSGKPLEAKVWEVTGDNIRLVKPWMAPEADRVAKAIEGGASLDQQMAIAMSQEKPQGYVPNEIGLSGGQTGSAALKGSQQSPPNSPAKAYVSDQVIQGATKNVVEEMRKQGAFDNENISDGVLYQNAELLTINAMKRLMEVDPKAVNLLANPDGSGYASEILELAGLGMTEESQQVVDNFNRAWAEAGPFVDTEINPPKNEAASTGVKKAETPLRINTTIQSNARTATPLFATGVNNSIFGLAYQASTGNPFYEIDPSVKLSTVESLGADIVSLLDPITLGLMFTGSGVATLGMRKLAEGGVKKFLQKTVIQRMVTSAGAGAAIGGTQEGLRQSASGEKLDVLGIAKSAAKTGTVFAVFGGAGGAAAKFGTAAEIGAEAVAGGTSGPIIEEGRLPELSDIGHFAFVALAMRAAMSPIKKFENNRSKEQQAFDEFFRTQEAFESEIAKSKTLTTPEGMSMDQWRDLIDKEVKSKVKIPKELLPFYEQAIDNMADPRVAPESKPAEKPPEPKPVEKPPEKPAEPVKPKVEPEAVKAAEPKPAAKPESKATKSDAVVDVPISEVKTDTKTFQNRRDSFSEESAADIAENFDPNKFDPIVLFKDPETGNSTVISGHSRLEGMRRRGAETVPARFFEGTKDEAIDFARIEANRLQSRETLIEDLDAFDRVAAKEATTNKDLKKRFGSNARFLESARHLNRKGKFVEIMGQETSSQFPFVKNFARRVGDFRKEFPQLTNQHESQIFDFLYRDPNGKKNYQMSQDAFEALIDSNVRRIDFDPSAPLILKKGELPLVGTAARGDTGPHVARIRELEAQIKANQTRLRATGEGKVITKEERTALSNEVLSARDEIAKLEGGIRQLVEGQGDIFANLTKIEDDAVSRIENRTKSEGTTLRSGFSPSDFANLGDAVIIGAVRIAKGAVTFAQFSKEMIEKFGEKIEPQLKDIFEKAQEQASKLPGPAASESAKFRIGVKAEDIGADTKKLPESAFNDLGDFAVVGAEKVAEGANGFGSFTKAMVEEFGENIKPRIKEIFRDARDIASGKREASFVRLRNLHESISIGSLGKVGKDEVTKKLKLELKAVQENDKLNPKIKAAREKHIQNAIATNEAERLGVATSKDAEGNVSASVNKAGIYVPVEFTNYEGFQDIRGTLTLDPTRGIQRIDGALSAESKVKTDKQAGVTEHFVLFRNREIRQMQIEFNQEMSIAGDKIVGKLSKPDRERLTHVTGEISREMSFLKPEELVKRQQISRFTDDIEIVKKAIEMRKLLDRTIDMENEMREFRNQKQIPYEEKYTPDILKSVSAWEQAFGWDRNATDVMGRDHLPDFRVPDKPFNPRELAKAGKLEFNEKEFDAAKILDNYLNTVTRDIFNTEIIQNNKAFAEQFRSMNLHGAAKFIEDYTAEAFAGVKGGIDRGAHLSGKAAKIMLKFRKTLNISTFPLNFMWTMTTQTSSSGLTVARYGVKNSTKALFNWFGDAGTRQRILENYYSSVAKGSRSARISQQDVTGTGSSRVALRVNSSKLDNAVDFANIFTEYVEKTLTGWSIEAARLHGEELGLKGTALKQYASDGGAKTQSMYNREDAPAILRNEVIKTFAPFQTFSFELYNTMKEFGGKAGTPPATTKKRIGQVGRFLGSVMAINYIQSSLTGKEPWDFRGFVPFYGSLVAPIFDDEFSSNTRSLPAPVGVAKEFVIAWKDVIGKGRWTNLRQWATRYGTAIAGIPGGAQGNRMIDGAIAVAQGGEKSPSGKMKFPIVSTTDQILALTGGKYATSGGREYLDKAHNRNSLIEQILKPDAKVFLLPFKPGTDKKPFNLNPILGPDGEVILSVEERKALQKEIEDIQKDIGGSK